MKASELAEREAATPQPATELERKLWRALVTVHEHRGGWDHHGQPLHLAERDAGRGAELTMAERERLGAGHVGGP